MAAAFSTAVLWGCNSSSSPVVAEPTKSVVKRDPLERNNVAYSAEYAELANWFRNKLGNIVLGDGRVEADWRKANAYHISNFAQGADDKTLDIPKEFIPN